MATLDPVFFELQPVEQLAAGRLHCSKRRSTHALRQRYPDWAIRQSLEPIQNHGNRCVYFFHPDPRARHHIAIMAGWNVMAQVFVRAVGMVSSDIERYSARPGNGTDHREIDSHCLRQNTGFLKADRKS